MRLRTPTIPSLPILAIRLSKLNRAIEAQAPIIQNINPLRLEIRRRIHNANIARLDKVVCDEQVLLIRRYFDVVRSDDALVFVGVIEPLDVGQVGDVERGDVVSEREGEVGEGAVVCDVGVDGEVVAGFGTEVEEELCDALLALGVLAEGVDDPDLAGSDGGGEGGGLAVTGAIGEGAKSAEVPQNG